MLQKPSDVVERFDEEVYNKKNLAVVDELVSKDVIIHTFDTVVHGRDSWKETINSVLAMIPDLHSATEFTVQQGDKVVARYVASGIHAPTGKRVSIAGDAIFRIVDGLIVEMWRHPDSLGWARQTGAVQD